MVLSRTRDVIIVENSVEELIQVYPNPTQGELKIEFKRGRG